MSETPSKGDAESTGTPHIAKDRKCPFCNKDFTSSSLGRHLDLWIKEKNPKPADGVHDVDAIKKLRGHVTRRQYKRGLGSRRDSSGSAQTTATNQTPTAALRRSPAASDRHVNSTASPLVRKDSAAAIPGFNVHNFAVTGVINGIDKDQEHGAQVSSNEALTQRTKASQVNMDMVKKVQDAEDRAKAAELALREMVGSWRAAKLHIDMTSNPFDFDPLILDFPALTLQCLQPPPTLSSLNPYSTDTSWSIQPPGEQQYRALGQYFSAELRQWRIRCAAATTALQEDIQYPPSESAFKSDPQEAIRRAEKLADDLEEKVQEHIKTAYSKWSALTPQRRQDTWILELARGVGKKQQQMESMQDEQRRLRQENSNLRSQIDQLNKLQQPREFKMMVPATLPVDQKFLDLWLEQAVVHGRRNLGMNLDDRRLDIGTAVRTSIDRWMRVVVSNRPSAGGGVLKRGADQAGLDGEDHADSPASSALVSNQSTRQNKAQALSGEDGRPLPRIQSAGASAGHLQSAVTNSIASTPDQRPSPRPNGVPTSVLASPAFPKTTPPGYSHSMHSLPVTVGPSDADASMSEKDALAEQDDGLSDRDAEADRDDEMTDQDADAEMEDDDEYSNAHQQGHQVGPTTSHAQQSAPSHQLNGASLQASTQIPAPVPHTRFAVASSLNGNGATGAAGNAHQPGISGIRYSVPSGTIRTPSQAYLASN